VSLPKQAVLPGRLEQPYRRELNRLAEGAMLQRLWSKDSSLWLADEQSEQRRGCAGAILVMHGDDDPETKEAERYLRKAGAPVVTIEMHSPAELGATLFEWEIATALACALLNVNPLDEPDVHAGKERAAEILDGLIAKGELPSKTVRVGEKGLELYAQGEARQQISTRGLGDAFRTFFELKSRMATWRSSRFWAAIRS
jgi:hypothetical protein